MISEAKLRETNQCSTMFFSPIYELPSALDEPLIFKDYFNTIESGNHFLYIANNAEPDPDMLA